MWMMLQQEQPDDFVIATGETSRLEDFMAEAFRCVGLDLREYVESDATLMRPSEIMVSRSNPAKASQILGWQANFRMKDIVRQMLELQL